MQLNKITLVILFFPFFVDAQLQRDSVTNYQYQQRTEKSSKDKDIEVNFLFNYYEQDGNHSPVTGGQGTERLDNIAPAIIINVPLDSLSTLNVNAGLDYYSSASTGNIDYFEDPEHRSSASHKDMRYHINLGYSKDNPDRNASWGISAGGSVEYDVFSLNLGASYTLNSVDQNRSATIHGRVLYDKWSLIYPVEKRTGEEWLKDDVRMTYTMGLSYHQVINQRLHALFSSEIVYQKGLLSTPFHRVFFGDPLSVPDKKSLASLSQVEQLDDNRFKIPLSVRLNYYLNDLMRLRTFYRFYTDNWGITSHTASVETPIQLGYSVIISPFYRFYTQTEADYFAPFGGFSADPPPRFFTSDYDLSSFDSHKIGLEFKYQPLMGIGKSKSSPSRITRFRSIGLRTAYYDRSDGLTAWLVTLELGFVF